MKNMLKSLSVAALMLLASGCLCLVFVGCTSYTNIKWGGQTALRDRDGNVITNSAGVPYFESPQNEYTDRNILTRREERDVSVGVKADGSYSAGLGARSNGVTSNEIAMVSGTITATTKLISTVAAAYVTIAGGGAQADTAAALAAKAVQYFVSNGGKAEKATVSADTATGTVKVTDGTTTVDCKDGSCSVVQ